MKKPQGLKEMTDLEVKFDQVVAENNAMSSEIVNLGLQAEELESKLVAAQTGFNHQRARAQRHAISLIAAHMKIARLCGYIERVHIETRTGPIREYGPDDLAGTARSPEHTVEGLLAMGDRQFGRTIDAMGQEELETILGKPEEFGAQGIS